MYVRRRGAAQDTSAAAQPSPAIASRCRGRRCRPGVPAHAHLALSRHFQILLLPQPPCLPICSAAALAAAAAAAAAVQAQPRGPGSPLLGAAASTTSCRRALTIRAPVVQQELGLGLICCRPASCALLAASGAAAGKPRLCALDAPPLPLPQLLLMLKLLASSEIQHPVRSIVAITAGRLCCR